MIDKYLLMFIIGAIIIVAGIVVYPQIVSDQTNIVRKNQDYIINEINDAQANRTKQFLALSKLQLINQKIGLINQNSTLKNQELIRESQELIKNNTANNLNLTIHNRKMLDDTNVIIHKLYDFLINQNQTNQNK